jgi:hypothetical protein
MADVQEVFVERARPSHDRNAALAARARDSRGPTGICAIVSVGALLRESARLYRLEADRSTRVETLEKWFCLRFQ